MGSTMDDAVMDIAYADMGEDRLELPSKMIEALRPYADDSFGLFTDFVHEIGSDFPQLAKYRQDKFIRMLNITLLFLKGLSGNDWRTNGSNLLKTFSLNDNKVFKQNLIELPHEWNGWDGLKFGSELSDYQCEILELITSSPSPLKNHDLIMGKICSRISQNPDLLLPVTICVIEFAFHFIQWILDPENSILELKMLEKMNFWNQYWFSSIKPNSDRHLPKEEFRRQETAEGEFEGNVKLSMIDPFIRIQEYRGTPNIYPAALLAMHGGIWLRSLNWNEMDKKPGVRVYHNYDSLKDILPRSCGECEMLFDGKRSDAKYCSRKCQNRVAYRKNKMAVGSSKGINNDV